MALFYVLFGIFCVATFFMPWVNRSKIKALNDEVELLYRKIKKLESDSVGTVKKETSPSESKEIPRATLSQKVETVRSEDKTLEALKKLNPIVEPIKSHSSVPKSSEIDWAKKAKSTFEENIATKLPVWIGAVSLIFAAFFLVKYSIDAGWLGPFVRTTLGALFGVSLLMAGQWLVKRNHIANAHRMAQGLVGAGLVALYISIYAAINVHGFLPPISGFLCMTIVTGLAVVLSLKHGQPIAVFGLLGGLLTPVMVGSDDPNALVMFTYLFLLFSGMFSVLVRKGWWVLAIVSVLGVFSWSAFWFAFVFDESDAVVLLLFSMAITTVILAITGRKIVNSTIKEADKLAVHGLNFTAIAGAVITIIALQNLLVLTLFDWSMLGLLSIALIVLTYFQTDVYKKPLRVKLVAILLLFFTWVHDVPLGDALTVLFGIVVIYIGGSDYMMRRTKDPRFWAGIQIFTVTALYLISYIALDIPATFMQSFDMLWGMIALALAGGAIYQVSNVSKNYKRDDVIGDHLLALYAFGASLFISLGLVIEMPWEYVPLAIAGQIAATAWVYKQVQIDFLKKIILLLTVIFMALNYEQVLLFIDIIFNSLFGDTPSKYVVRSYALDIPLIKLGVPSVLIALSLWTVKGMKKGDWTFDNILFGAALALFMATSYYIFRDLWSVGGVDALKIRAGFVERGVMTVAIASAGIGLLQVMKRYDLSFLKIWGEGLFHLGMIRFAYFDLFIFNPYKSSSQFVGDFPILNGITFIYGAGVLLSLWAIYNKELLVNKTIYKALGFISLFALITLTVRQFFHGGNLVAGTVFSAELYAYSVAWLLTGIALLAVGIKRKSKAARMVSLAFILLAIVKVFLFDAAELDGLYRVFSFLGLGVSLIGLSYFYTKFVFADELPQKDS